MAELHGHNTRATRSLTHNTWRAMKARCFYPSHSSYKNYGAKGIEVCERWLTFADFLEDMGERAEGMFIDRIDPEKDYEPDNCRWVTRKQQRHNQRSPQ